MLCLLLGGCAGGQAVLPQHLPAQAAAAPVELTDTPFFPQQRYQCGPAALAMVLQATGAAVTPGELVDQVYLPARKGSLQVEMLAAARRHGRLAYRLPPTLDALLAELRAGHPVLVLQNLGVGWWPFWHYAVVVGYAPASDGILLRSGRTRRKRMSAADFLETWRRGGSWGVVVLAPGELPAQADAERYLAAVADLEASARAAVVLPAYEAAVRRWPEQSLAWLGLGNASYLGGDPGRAESAYREALRRAPASAVAHNNLAEVLADRGCFGAALAELDAALAAAGPGDPLRGRVQATRTEILRRQAQGGSGTRAACPGGS